MIVALAGRRIDSPDSREIRFPLHNVAVVQQRLRAFFSSNTISTLVCSAACGIDLLALNIARDLNITRKIILPFAPDVFKIKSVDDCVGDWTSFFENLLMVSDSNAELVVLNSRDDDRQAYEKTNVEILGTAEKLAHLQNEKKIALVAWDGKSRGTDDASAHFLNEAKNRKFTIKEINTL